LSSTPAKEVQPAAALARHHSHALMHFLLFWGTVFWASNIVAGKEAVAGLGAMGLAQLRLAGAAILFGVLFLAWRGRPELRLSGRQWLVLTVVAFNGMTLNQICFINGLAWTSVAHTGLIVALGPVMVLALSCLIRLEPLTLPKLLGMLISFGGVAILTLGGAEKGSAAHWPGDLIVLAGSVSFAYYTIQVKEIANRYDALTLNTLTFAIGSLLMIPFAARSVSNIRWANVTLAAWGSLAFMVVLGTVVAYLFYAFALTELSASRVAAFAYLQPVVAALLGTWLLGERITLKVVAGGALILLGVYLAERERGEEGREQGTGNRE
jgi:drug/metabolite transporter (DMT)-like permease